MNWIKYNFTHSTELNGVMIQETAQGMQQVIGSFVDEKCP